MPDRPVAGAERWSLVRQADGHLAVVRGEAVAGLELSDPDVLSVETDVAEHTLAGIGENDPMRAQQWALDRAPFEAAWATTRGAGVIVAVVDTGVDAAHEDLGSVVLPGIDYVDPVATAASIRPVTVRTSRASSRRGSTTGAASWAPHRACESCPYGFSTRRQWRVVERRGRDHLGRRPRAASSTSVSAAVPSSGVQMAIQYALIEERGRSSPAGGQERLAGTQRSIRLRIPRRSRSRGTTRASKVPFSNTGSYVDIARPGTTSFDVVVASMQHAVASGTSMATPYSSPRPRAV